LHFGFETLGLDSVVSICEPDKVASTRVMNRLGMCLDRETIHPVRDVPLRVYRLDRADWAAHNPAG